jgi:protein-tyrosine-phosphatase
MNLDAASVIDRMGEFAKGIGKPTAATRKAFLKSVGDFFDNVMVDAAAKKLVAYTASGQALAEMAKRYGINSGYELETTIREQGGAQWKAALALDATTTNLVNWLKGQSDTNKKALFRLIHTSTREQVDPYADRSKYKGNKVKLQVWEDMNKKGGDVKAVGKDGEKIYTEMRKVYSKQIDQVEARLRTQVDEMKDADGNPLKKEAKEKLQNSIFDKIFAKNRIEPTSP